MLNQAAKDQIEKTKSFLRSLWKLENDRPAFLIGYAGDNMIGGEPVKSALFSVDGKDTVKDRLLDPAKYLQAQLDEIEGQLKFEGDFVPALCPSLGVVALASAFGCEVKWWEEDFPAALPAIQSDPNEIFDLRKPSVTGGELGRVLDYTKYFINETNGILPIKITDVQGPLDTAALILGHTNFLMALQTHPEAIHHLLDMITILMIEFIRAQRKIVNDAGVEFVPAMFQPWLPDGEGITISNDECVMISPEMHDEFHVPYINRLSDEFGGIYIHSCGNWEHQFESLAKVRNLRGLEFGASEVPFKKVLDRFNGEIVLCSRVGFHQMTKFKGMYDYASQILEAAKTHKGLCVNIDITNGIIDDDWLPTDLNKIYSLFKNENLSA